MEGMKSKRVAILYGGRSAEREVSLWSGEAIHRALVEKGYDAFLLDVDLEVAARLRESGADVAFIGLHGRFGEDGCVQGLLESMGIPYTGSGVLASALALDKVASKHVFVTRGIPTPLHVSLSPAQAESVRVEDLPFSLPVVVKPASEGSSVGVKIVRTPEDFPVACREAAGFKGDILVERYHKGREVQVAVVDDEAIGAIEVVPAAEFYDYQAKYKSAGATKYLFPAPLAAELERSVLDTALAAHRALGCSGYSRTDLIVDAAGEIWVLEVNTLPGMTETSLLPKIAAGVGIPFPDLCERILLGASLKA